MRRYAGSRSIRADVLEVHTSSDEGVGRLADGARRADEGLAPLCQQGIARRDQHHLRVGGSLRQGSPARLLPAARPAIDRRALRIHPLRLSTFSNNGVSPQWES